MTAKTNTPTFTSDWAPQIRSGWPLHVFPLLDRQSPVRWLEIGSFEGRSALWTVENMLTHPESQITCVDVWQIWEKYEERIKYDSEKTFDANTAGLSKIVKIKGPSKDVLPTLPGHHFHGCYIDGSHEEVDVLEDARLALELMRPGAVMVFDDYHWPKGKGVKQAVDALIVKWTSVAKVVHMGYQAIFQVNA